MLLLPSARISHNGTALPSEVGGRYTVACVRTVSAVTKEEVGCGSGPLGSKISSSGQDGGNFSSGGDKASANFRLLGIALSRGAPPPPPAHLPPHASRSTCSCMKRLCTGPTPLLHTEAWLTTWKASLAGEGHVKYSSLIGEVSCHVTAAFDTGSGTSFSGCPACYFLLFKSRCWVGMVDTLCFGDSAKSENTFESCQEGSERDIQKSCSIRSLLVGLQIPRDSCGS